MITDTNGQFKLWICVRDLLGDVRLRGFSTVKREELTGSFNARSSGTRVGRCRNHYGAAESSVVDVQNVTSSGYSGKT